MSGSEADDSFSESSDVETAAVEDNGEEGWANAMAKILGKQGKDDYVVLSKTKVTVDEVNDKATENEMKNKLKKKRKWENMNYSKPNVLEKDFEKSLQKIATRGVVQLFNAVRKHQKSLDEKMTKAKTIGKQDKVMKDINKGEFLDMLNDNNTKAKKAKKEEDKPAWDVLKDDFMLGEGMKDWDKQEEEIPT